ncbi:MAG TPA: ATP-binding protein, partial [Solirubrobacterales bacterium]|nr:ATP-binding protein [Solirubrobacterales bacterium]
MPAIARSEPFSEQACPVGVCDGSGWILGPEDVARPCECREQRLKRGRSRGVLSTLPSRFRGVSYDRPPVSDMARDMTARHVVQATRDYVENLDTNLAAGRGIWLMGTTGTGKTTLAMLVAKQALAAGKTVGIYFAPKLLTRIRQTYQEAESNRAYETFFREVTSVDLLYIDDLGSERRTDWVVEQLYAVINERYENQRPMLVTSNSDSDVDQDADHGLRQLKEQIGPRTVSRLVEICGDPLPLFGPDRR